MRTLLIALFLFIGCAIAPPVDIGNGAYAVNERLMYTTTLGVEYTCPVKTDCAFTIHECTRWQECYTPKRPGDLSGMTTDGMGTLYLIYHVKHGIALCPVTERCTPLERWRNLEFCVTFSRCRENLPPLRRENGIPPKHTPPSKPSRGPVPA